MVNVMRRVFARNIRQLALAVTLCVAAGVAFQPTAVHACSGSFPPYSIAEHVRASDYVVEGTVLEGNYPRAGRSGHPLGPVEFTATIAVQIVYKATTDLPSKIAVAGFGGGRGDCLNYVEIGQYAIFFIDQGSNSENPFLIPQPPRYDYTLNYPEPYAAVAFPTSQTAVMIINATGRLPITRDSSEELRDEIAESRFAPTVTPLVSKTPRPPSATLSDTPTLVPILTYTPTPTLEAMGEPPPTDLESPSGFPLVLVSLTAIGFGVVGYVIGRRTG